MHEPSTGASLARPLCNVTIPVFNRPAATSAVRALAQTSREVPFQITVVDNGSEPELVKTLLRLRGEGIIDNLFAAAQHGRGLCGQRGVGTCARAAVHEA